MELNSSAFSNASAIPKRFTCDGGDLSPPFDWKAAPATTRSFVLLCDDPDVPGGKWHHWAYNIGASETNLAEGAGRDSGSAKFKQAINDFRRVGTEAPARPMVTGDTVIIFAPRFQLITYHLHRSRT
jgi:phosphatidylethanolamine-binding protein (PEBP) family uncharacterized protein